MTTCRRCVECGRIFDMTKDEDIDEWFNGHDCEESASK